MRKLMIAAMLTFASTACGEMVIDDFDQTPPTTGNLKNTTNKTLNDAFAGTTNTFTTGGFGSSVVTGATSITTTIGSSTQEAVLVYDFDPGSAIDLLTTSSTALFFDLFQSVTGTVNYQIEIDDADPGTAAAVFNGSVASGEVIGITNTQIGAGIAGDIDSIRLTFSTPDLGGAQFSSTAPSILAVPEPSTYVLFGLTGLGFVWYQRRRKALAEVC